MKKLFTILILLSTTALLAVTDPNTPTIPPKPGIENISVVDSNTLRITTSKDVKKSTLIAQKQRLLKQRQDIDKQIEIINTKLANFK